MNYYTLQIKYGGTTNPQTEELKDLTSPPEKEKEFIRSIREKLYTTGFQIETSPGVAWEFISPFRIHTVYLLKQDKKFGI